jgi:SAM-dependent methyltransferase
MSDNYDDTPAYWDKKAKIPIITSKPSPAWVYASQYWTAKFLEISKNALSRIETGNQSLQILKTDLWNEGIETQRGIIEKVKEYMKPAGEFFAIDISKYVASKAKDSKHRYLSALQSSITNLPFKRSIFDLVLDMSTTDHIDVSLRKKVIQEYGRVLKSGGVIALVFDNRNLLFYLALLKDSLGKLARRPGKTRLMLLHFGPDSVERLKQYLTDERFDILAEGIGALNIGVNTLFSGRKSRIFNYLLDYEPIQRAMYRLENSRVSKHFAFFALQYFVICRRN